MITWLCNFRLHVNEVVGGDFLQFTAELWSPPSNTGANLDVMEVDEMVETAIPEEEWEKWEEKVTV
eukprot:7107439-Ditylum_brightwellii.AAC.1